MARGWITDRKWPLFAPLVVATGAKSGRPQADHLNVLDAVVWIARNGAPWRDLDHSFGNGASVYRQFRRWTLMGVWHVMLEALNKSGRLPQSVQMIDCTIIRAHHRGRA